MRILLVESDLAAVHQFQHACQQAVPRVDLRVAQTGEEAILYLAGEGKYADRDRHPVPKLVFLAINLSDQNGLEVLKWIRVESELKGIPVVVLSVDSTAREIERAYDLYSNSVLPKQPALTVPSVLGSILKYWAVTNEVPRELRFTLDGR